MQCKELHYLCNERLLEFEKFISHLIDLEFVHFWVCDWNKVFKFPKTRKTFFNSFLLKKKTKYCNFCNSSLASSGSTIHSIFWHLSLTFLFLLNTFLLGILCSFLFLFCQMLFFICLSHSWVQAAFFIG